MSIFIDTGIFSAMHNKRDNLHERSVEILKEILRKKYGNVFTSDYIIDECLTLALYQTKNKEIAIDLGNAIFESELIEIIKVDEDILNRAWEIFVNRKKFLSFTDCTTIAIMEKMKIGKIASFDSDFDGLVKRVY